MSLESEDDGLTPIHHLTIIHYKDKAKNRNLYETINKQYEHLFIDKESNKSILMRSVIKGNINYLVALKKNIDSNLYLEMLLAKDNENKTPLIFAEQYDKNNVKILY